MNNQPCRYLTKDFPPTDPTQFVGPARDAAEKLKATFERALRNGRPAIKLFYSGPSGVGKTALCYYFQHLTQPNRRRAKLDPWNLYEVNGTDATIDWVRGMRDTLAMTHCDLYGLYRLICIHEADRIPNAAQVNLLSLLDDLPERTAFICTTNASLAGMEQRFTRRFMFTELGAATEDDIFGLLRQWDAPEYVCRMIAAGACGSVGLAMSELQEWLYTHSVRQESESPRAFEQRTMVMTA